MINAENDIYDTVSDELRDIYGKDIYLSGEYFDTPAKFPAVSIIEIDNSVYSRMNTTTIENAAKVAYEVNVYSNKVGYKKFQAKEIMGIVDRVMASMNFTRVMMSPVSNIQDASIYRLIARYEAIIDKDLWLYTE